MHDLVKKINMLNRNLNIRANIYYYKDNQLSSRNGPAFKGISIWEMISKTASTFIWIICGNFLRIIDDQSAHRIKRLLCHKKSRITIIQNDSNSQDFSEAKNIECLTLDSFKELINTYSMQDTSCYLNQISKKYVKDMSKVFSWKERCSKRDHFVEKLRKGNVMQDIIFPNEISTINLDTPQVITTESGIHDQFEITSKSLTTNNPSKFIVQSSKVLCYDSLYYEGFEIPEMIKIPEPIPKVEFDESPLSNISPINYSLDDFRPPDFGKIPKFAPITLIKPDDNTPNPAFIKPLMLVYGEIYPLNTEIQENSINISDTNLCNYKHAFDIRKIEPEIEKIFEFYPYVLVLYHQSGRTDSSHSTLIEKIKKKGIQNYFYNMIVPLFMIIFKSEKMNITLINNESHLVKLEDRGPEKGYLKPFNDFTNPILIFLDSIPSH